MRDDHMENKNSHKILIGKSRRKETIWNYYRKWEDESDLKKKDSVEESGLGSSGSCAYGNKLSNFLKGGEFLDSGY
jgi:hypothetical protein